ncbi:hypothetical protein RI129_012819 [Pyrocoelia pectoralis]|uniref:Uncharacterized protein n=1 Tax=Pyrocoelia pectoralis TaxID=417401 RepID=A0AAN7V801_9COLE
MNKANIMKVSKSTNKNENKTRNCRTRLQDRFDESDNHEKSNRSILTIMTLEDTRRILRTGAEKLCKTFNDLRTNIGTFTQRFRTTTKRRQILEEGPVTPGCSTTPYTFSKRLLGRTPTKLYSPFSIDSPYNKPLTSTTHLR